MRGSSSAVPGRDGRHETGCSSSVSVDRRRLDRYMRERSRLAPQATVSHNTGRFSMRSFAQAVIAVAAAGAALSPALAQSTLDFPTGLDFEYVLDTGDVDGDVAQIALSHDVKVTNAAWVRLYFSQATLGDGSFVRMTSLRDGEVQELDAAGLAMWSNTSAYFNGDTVRLELIVGQGTQGNRIAIDHVAALISVDTRGGAGQCGICGGADDRTASSEDWSGRLMPVGCT